jgi:hypothetical protein
MKPDLPKKFSRILVDFVNTADTGGAVLSLLNQLQRHFTFSMDLCQRFESQFPSIDSIAAGLGDDEKTLLKIILEKNEVVDRLNDHFKLINYGIEKYDPRARTISLTSLEWNRDANSGGGQYRQAGHDGADGGGFLQTLKLLGLSIVDGPVSIKVDVIKPEIENLLGPIAAGYLSTLIRAGHEIDELISAMGESKYEKLIRLVKERRDIFRFHRKIAAIQTNCGTALKMIIQDRPYHDIPTLVEYLEIYNNIEPHRLIIVDENRLVPVFAIGEPEDFSADKIAGWLDVLQQLVAYCLIEFLKSEKGRKRLKGCATCGQYFIARQPKTQKFCKKQCRLIRKSKGGHQ